MKKITIAIDGHSSCGKSTIANLIGRIYDATEGEIKIFGNDIKAFQPCHNHREPEPEAGQ